MNICILVLFDLAMPVFECVLYMSRLLFDLARFEICSWRNCLHFCTFCMWCLRRGLVCLIFEYFTCTDHGPPPSPFKHKHNFRVHKTSESQFEWTKDNNVVRVRETLESQFERIISCMCSGNAYLGCWKAINTNMLFDLLKSVSWTNIVNMFHLPQPLSALI